MDITVVKEYDFIPEWRDNKKEQNPIKFHMRRLTTSERDRVMPLRVVDGKAAFEPDRQGMFLTAVMSIDFLKVNGEPLKTARDVLGQPGLDSLFMEVVSDILNQNQKEDLKNS